VIEAGSLGRPQRPRPAKRRRERDIDSVQVAVEGKILCCGDKQNSHYVEENNSPRDYDEKLAVYCRFGLNKITYLRYRNRDQDPLIFFVTMATPRTRVLCLEW
jgi:hypothetical protein